MAKVFKRPAARRDLIEHYVRIATHSGLDAADRFLARAEESFADLLGQPRMGAPLDSARPELAGSRMWHVKDFPKYLIFYLPHSRGITIVRVLHASQDWWGLLDIN
jgi:toxin ParE1/3/4